MSELPLLESAGEAAARAEHVAAVPDSLPPEALSTTSLDRALWEQRGAELGRAHSTNSWAIGDWMLHGEAAWEVPVEVAEKVSQLAAETLRKSAYVAARFESVRRRTNLPFAHHEAVASLPPSEADELLARAGREALSLRALRELAARHKPVPKLDLAAELLASLLRAAASERKQLASVPGADRARALHEQYVAELQALAGQEAHPAAYVSQDDRADADDILHRRGGWVKRG